MKCLIIEHNDLGKHTAEAAFFICGEVKEVKGIEFLKSAKPATVLKKLNDLKKTFETDEEIYILVDFVGGTPFNAAMKFKLNNPDLNICVLAGFNMPIVIEICMAVKFKIPVDPEKILNKGREAMKVFK